MIEKQKTLRLFLDEKEIEITVKRATAGDGIKRGLLIFAAMEAKEKGEIIDEVEYILSSRSMPSLTAGTESIKGMDFPTVKELALLPEEFVDNWLKAIFELNKTWDPENFRYPEIENEKKTNS